MHKNCLPLIYADNTDQNKCFGGNVFTEKIDVSYPCHQRSSAVRFVFCAKREPFAVFSQVFVAQALFCPFAKAANGTRPERSEYLSKNRGTDKSVCATEYQQFAKVIRTPAPELGPAALQAFPDRVLPELPRPSPPLPRSATIPARWPAAVKPVPAWPAAIG